jgi:tetratricopeptide (TPR) repeat protein
VLGDLGRHAEAVALFERAGADLEASLGHTPELANLWINEATALGRLGRHDEVIPKYERALAILEKSSDELGLATALNNLGDIYYRREALDAARRHFERALAILERTLGPDHPDTGFPRIGLARVFDSEGRHAEAIAAYETVVRVNTAALGHNLRMAAVALNGIAQILSEEKRFDEALATLDREEELVATMPHVRTDDRLTLATVRVEVLLAQGDPTAAIPRLEEAVARASAESVEGGRIGESELTLAIALAEIGRTTDARGVVESALRHLEHSPENAELVPIARALQAELAK